MFSNPLACSLKATSTCARGVAIDKQERRFASLRRARPDCPPSQWMCCGRVACRCLLSGAAARRALLTSSEAKVLAGPERRDDTHARRADQRKQLSVLLLEELTAAAEGSHTQPPVGGECVSEGARGGTQQRGCDSRSQGMCRVRARYVSRPNKVCVASEQGVSRPARLSFRVAATRRRGDAKAPP